MNAEFTKIRLRSGHTTLQAFRAAVNDGLLETKEEGSDTIRHPRWIRINTLKTTLADQISTTFADFNEVDSLAAVLSSQRSSKTYFVDTHIPNLLAIPSKIDLSRSKAYTSGQIIFQDKASCFPAYLINPTVEDGDIIDGCAAPGNKTTHLAAALGSLSNQEDPDIPQKVLAFERDPTRTKILEKMVRLSSADKIVSIKGTKDFLSAKPTASEFANVGAILLDPSCSGSGIVGRDDNIQMHLPEQQSNIKSSSVSGKGKKRKRDNEKGEKTEKTSTLSLDLDDVVSEETPVSDKLSERLTALSTFQLRILQHAMQFPSARKITYSTCSIHFEENEGVVIQALTSRIAREGGWRILKRGDQVDGMKRWERRGVPSEGEIEGDIGMDVERSEILEACIRCEKGTGEGTMGFFVAGFVRDASSVPVEPPLQESAPIDEQMGDEEEDREEWNGFSDEEEIVVQPTAKTSEDTNGSRAAEPKPKKKRKHNNK